MKAPPLDFMTALAIADNAAQLLEKQRLKHEVELPAEFRAPDQSARDRKWRMFGRENPIAALRWLWKNGDYNQRSLVACRVAVWLGFPPERVKKTGGNIANREKARLA